MIYIHESTETNQVFLRKKGNKGNIVECFAYGDKSARENAELVAAVLSMIVDKSTNQVVREAENLYINPDTDSEELRDALAVLFRSLNRQRELRTQACQLLHIAGR